MCASKFLFSYKHQFILRYENCRAILYGAFRGVVVNFFLLTNISLSCATRIAGAILYEVVRGVVVNFFLLTSISLSCATRIAGAILYEAFRGVVVNFFLLTRLLIPLSVFRRRTAELPLEKADKIRNVFKAVFKGDVSNCS